MLKFQLDSQLKMPSLWIAIGVILLLTIVYFSFASSSPISMPGHSDKLYHGLAYMLLMGWWLQLFPAWLARSFLALLFISLGLLIEYLQSFHPLRHLDILDMLSNSAGVLIGWLLGFTWFGKLLYWIEQRYIS